MRPARRHPNTRIPAALLAVFVLGACAVADRSVVPDEYRDSSASAAYLVGSIGAMTSGATESRYDINRVDFRRKGGGKLASLTIAKGRLRPSKIDFAEGDRIGAVFSLKLVPGEYEIVNVYFRETGGVTGQSYSAAKDFSVPFAVAAGKVTYIGEFLAHGMYARNLLGFRVMSGGVFVHGAKQDRDMKLLLNKYPEIRGLELVPLDLPVHAPPYILQRKSR